MLQVIITIIHVLSCLFLVLVVLLQTGKGADMGAVFGGSSSTVFGSSGAGNFLTRLTTATAVVFMLTSLSLTYFSGQSNTATVFDSAPAAVPAPLGAPAGGQPQDAPPAGPESAQPEPQAAVPLPDSPLGAPQQSEAAAPN